MSVTIEQVDRLTEDVQTLVRELEETLAVHYEPEQQHGLSIDRLFEPGVRFFVARLGEAPAGCCGVALFDDHAELKRMYVRESARGNGIADSLLERIEAEVRESGGGPLRLETGIHQHAAIRFYEKKGFRRCEPFGAYVELPPHTIELSLFFEKGL